MAEEVACVVNEALCLALSYPAPHQLFCGTIVPPIPDKRVLSVPVTVGGREEVFG